MRQGFTLIELSIVLVIIGLIVGGVLTGQSLIAAAAVRAQITQIEKFNAATNTFREKYGGLPGDLAANLVNQFGFISRAGSQGRGDGNGLIEGWCYSCGGGSYADYELREEAFYWEDLSQAHLIEGSFTTNIDGTPALYPEVVSTWFPAGKVGNSNYVYVYVLNGLNYFGLSAVSTIYNWGDTLSTPALTVQQAYNMDKKVDDGYPTTGNVIAAYLNSPPLWMDGTQMSATSNVPASSAATPGSATTCYDNSNNTSNKMAYSLAQSNGNGVNCALSFRMQAGD